MRLSRNLFSKLLLSFLVLATCLVCYHAIDNWYLGAADNTFLVELAEEISTTGLPMSRTAHNVNLAFKKLYLNPPTAKELCSLPLNENFGDKFNYFKWHTYVILYLIAPLNYFFDAKTFMPALNALSHMCLLFLLALFLLRHRVTPLNILLALSVTALHPAWSQGLAGQIYIDRYFLSLGFGYLLSLKNYTKNKLLTISILIIITSLSDRFGLLAFLITIGFLIACAFTRKSKTGSIYRVINEHLPLIGISVCCLAYSLFIIKFYLAHPSYANFSSNFSLAGILHNFANNTFRMNAYKFITLNIICFAPIIVFSKYRIIYLGLFLINLLGNVGGAEKIDYFTHYHSVHFPVLIFLMYDFVSSYKNNYKVVLASLFFTFTALIIFTPFASSSTSDINASYFSTLLSKSPLLNLLSKPFGKSKYNINLQNELLLTIPKNATVTIPEPLMPTFYGRQTHYFPLGLAKADYAIVPRDAYNGALKLRTNSATADKGLPEYNMLIMYRGLLETKRANVCLSEKIDALHFTLVYQNAKWLILKRNKKEG